MIPASFDYVRADTVESALAALAEHGDEAKLLAGGHSLLPLMKLRLATPSVLVDIGRLGQLSYVRDGGDHLDRFKRNLRRHADLSRSEAALHEAPLLAHVAGQIGDPQVRHRGTIGGSIAHGDPASDLPAAVVALGGTLVISGPRGERTVPSVEFHRGFLETALAADELLTEIRVPKWTGARWSFQKFNRRAQDWAIVGVVAVRNGSTAVSLVNMGSVPLRASAVERAVAGGASAEEAAELAAEGTEPSADLHASVEFRQHLARVLVRRALEEVGG